MNSLLTQFTNQRKLTMIARKIVFALLCAVMLAVPSAGVYAQSSTEQESAQQAAAVSNQCDWLCQLKERQAQQLEGSWDVTVTPVVPSGVPQPPSFVAHATVSRGGGYFGSDRTRPFSKQHGVWAHLGSDEFAFTAVEDLFDATGNFTGTVKIRVKLTVTGRDTFVGVSNGEFRDVAGNITQSRCATVRGARLKLEPLPEQCQSITPPQ